MKIVFMKDLDENSTENSCHESKQLE